MLKENSSNSRLTFIKKASLAIVSVLGLGLTGLNFQKPQMIFNKTVDTLSKQEANDIIKNMHSHSSNHMKPEPPPKINQTLDGE